MNPHSRSAELDTLAREVLADLGLALETDHVKLLPAVELLQARAGCQQHTARRVIARNMRKRGLIVRTGGVDYRVVSITTLPHPPDAEPVPLILVAEQPA